MINVLNESLFSNWYVLTSSISWKKHHIEKYIYLLYEIHKRTDRQDMCYIQLCKIRYLKLLLQCLLIGLQIWLTA